MSGSRRHHTKSRNGCAQCKRRRVRCNCIAPVCSNCKRRNERCSFLDTDCSVSSSSFHGITAPGPTPLPARLRSSKPDRSIPVTAGSPGLVSLCVPPSTSLSDTSVPAVPTNSVDDATMAISHPILNPSDPAIPTPSLMVVEVAGVLFPVPPRLQSPFNQSRLSDSSDCSNEGSFNSSPLTVAQSPASTEPVVNISLSPCPPTYQQLSMTLARVRALQTTPHDSWLLHHFTKYTGSTIMLNPNNLVQSEWFRIVPEIVETQPFVHHALLSLAGLHMVALGTPDSRLPFNLACFHYQKASMLFREGVQFITEDNWIPTLVFSVATSIFHFYVPFADYKGLKHRGNKAQFSSSFPNQCGAVSPAASPLAAAFGRVTNMCESVTPLPSSCLPQATDTSSYSSTPEPEDMEGQVGSSSFNMLDVLTILRTAQGVVENIEPFLVRLGLVKPNFNSSDEECISKETDTNDDYSKSLFDSPKSCPERVLVPTIETAARQTGNSSPPTTRLLADNSDSEYPGMTTINFRDDVIPPAPNKNFDQEWLPRFGCIYELAVSPASNLSDSEREITLQALGCLKKWVYKIKGRPRTWQHLQVWPSLVPAGFFRLVAANSTPAMAIFNLWCFTIKQTRQSHTWYLKPWILKAFSFSAMALLSSGFVPAHERKISTATK